MDRTGKRPFVFFASLWTASFFLNFFWECVHGLLFQDHPGMAASLYVPMMIEMACYDAFGVSGLYLLVSLIFRSLLWENTIQHLAVFTLLALVAAMCFEYVAVHVLHAWRYLPAMPVLSGIGLLPLLQLAVTGLSAVLAARRISSGGNGV